jgi:5-methylcytosine-specific restriction endonuclease McrA
MSAYVSAELRRLVSARAAAKCEYCLLPEDCACASHEPDHIIAVKHDGATALENLAWACMVCNGLKGPNIASIDGQTGDVVRLFNPQIDRWSEHFKLSAAWIVPLTAIGRATAKLLQFNLPIQVENRRILLHLGRYP